MSKLSVTAAPTPDDSVSAFKLCMNELVKAQAEAKAYQDDAKVYQGNAQFFGVIAVLCVLAVIVVAIISCCQHDDHVQKMRWMQEDLDKAKKALADATKPKPVMRAQVVSVSEESHVKV